MEANTHFTWQLTELFISSVEAVHRQELSNSAAGVEIEELSSVAPPIELLSKSPDENGQLRFIKINQILG